MRTRSATRGETFFCEVTPMMFALMAQRLEPPAGDELRDATVVDTHDAAPT